MLAAVFSLALSRMLLGVGKGGRKRNEVAFRQVDSICALKKCQICGSDLVCIVAGKKTSPGFC